MEAVWEETFLSLSLFWFLLCVCFPLKEKHNLTYQTWSVGAGLEIRCQGKGRGRSGRAKAPLGEVPLQISMIAMVLISGMNGRRAFASKGYRRL